MHTQPSVLGLKKTFGFGDRLGLAGPGHIAALRGSSFTPILAQQSIRELTRTGRTADEVMNAARKAVETTAYNGPWGADADHIKTTADAGRMVSAGYTFFTIDPSDSINQEADVLSRAELLERVDADKRQVESLGISAPEMDAYLGRQYDTDCASYRFEEEALLRAVAKYGRALAHCEVMSRHIRAEAGKRPVEIEISIDETETTTSPLDHLYVALELARRSVNPVTIAPRFIGRFEKGVDYKGDVSAFEADLKEHSAIARAFGPYKVSIHSGSDKFTIYPIIGRLCGDLLHIKTAGTSYLEALRAVCRVDQSLFAEIAQYSLGHFSADKASYHISVTDEYVAGLQVQTDKKWLEKTFLDEDAGRQILHVTFGSVLSQGKSASGRPFKDAVVDILSNNKALHEELLARHLGRHIRELERG